METRLNELKRELHDLTHSIYEKVVDDKGEIKTTDIPKEFLDTKIEEFGKLVNKYTTLIKEDLDENDEAERKLIYHKLVSLRRMFQLGGIKDLPKIEITLKDLQKE